MGPGIKGKRIFLTGASGFIGSRLAECLTGAYEAEVHGLVRRVGAPGAARVARLAGVRMFYGDVRDTERVREAARGCAWFVHCVTGSPGSYRAQKAEELRGTANVLEAAAREGAERVVYFSSAAVHDPGRSGTEIREESPLNGKAVGWRKILAEALIAKYRERHRLPVIILRPTCVWGPFSPMWTVAAAELIKRGIPFLPLDGQGKANLVYVDNLVDAVYLALVKPEATGEVFLINDDEPGTWAELYGGYARFLGVPLRFVPDAPQATDLWRISLHNAALILKNAASGKAGSGMGVLRELYDHVPAVKAGVGMLPERVQQRLRTFAAGRARAEEASPSGDHAQPGLLPFHSISRSMRNLYGAQGRYSSERAKRVLGWRPRVSFPAALDVTCQWLHYAGYQSRA